MNLKIQKLNPNALLPTYGSTDAAGADLYACIDTEKTIAPGETLLVSTGIAMAIPTGYVGLIFARSGLACKRDLAPANKVGVIDSDYRGEIMVALHNHGKQNRTIEPAERIAQIAIMPVSQPTFELSESLDETQRGQGGFGSTGTKQPIYM